ncbi:transcription termination/antitermination NusG family protein [Castellaniella ginsengisoli]|uniref:transcription termination/antitermination NusG family protein n=1 Tax=Castellaniella ginsengisoli TaxID=546114 RepID=UPI003CD0BCA5
MNTPDLPSAWYVAHTKPRQERTAAEQLRRQDFEVYLPLFKVFREPGRRWRAAVAPATCSCGPPGPRSPCPWCVPRWASAGWSCSATSPPPWRTMPSRPSAGPKTCAKPPVWPTSAPTSPAWPCACGIRRWPASRHWSGRSPPTASPCCWTSWAARRPCRSSSGGSHRCSRAEAPPCLQCRL